METAAVIGPPAERSKYLRPLLVCLGLCLAGELFLFAVYGLVLFPEGNVLHKLAWAALCGVGMGLTTGGLVDLLIVDRLEGRVAVAATVVVFFGVAGVVCNVLCMKLDRHFYYWGGPEHSVEFMVTGAIMSVVGGTLAGWLLFSQRGTALLARTRFLPLKE